MTDVDEQLRIALDYGTQQYVSLCKAQDRYTVAEARVVELEAAIQSVYDVLGPGDDEDVDSPGNMAFAVLMSVCPLQMKGNDLEK